MHPIHFEDAGYIAYLYLDQGLTAAQIAKQRLMSESAVYRHLDAAGVERRPPGRQPRGEE